MVEGVSSSLKTAIRQNTAQHIAHKKVPCPGRLYFKQKKTSSNRIADAILMEWVPPGIPERRRRKGERMRHSFQTPHQSSVDDVNIAVEGTMP
jgi:hypothetical protein